MNSLDVAFVTPTLSGGLGKATLTLAETMRQRGLSVEVWLVGNHDEVQIELNVCKRNISASRIGYSLAKLVKMLRRHRPTNIISASYHMNCIVILAKLLGRVSARVITVEHTSLITGLGALPTHKRFLAQLSIATLYRLSDARVAVSVDAAQQVEKYAFMKAGSVQTIFNPIIGNDFYASSKDIVSHPFNGIEGKLFLWIGRVSEEKDLPTLIKAFYECSKVRRSHLLLVGDGPEFTKITQLIDHMGLSERVVQMGYVANPLPLYLEADAFVLSSKREGLPTVLIEALALGCPIVSTDARSGPREILQNGKLGALVPPGDVNALAAQMLKALDKKIDTKERLNPRLSCYRTDYAVDKYIKLLKLPAHIKSTLEKL